MASQPLRRDVGCICLQELLQQVREPAPALHAAVPVHSLLPLLGALLINWTLRSRLGSKWGFYLLKGLLQIFLQPLCSRTAYSKGGVMCGKKSFWGDHQYPASGVSSGSDRARGAHTGAMSNNDMRACRVHEAAVQASASSGARLIRLELLASRQSAALTAAERQITKLNTRARLLGRDLQPPLRQVSMLSSNS